MNKPDPKAFYDTVMPGKLGNDYELARWKGSPLLLAQYGMMEQVVEDEVIPVLPVTGSVVEAGPGAATWTKKLHDAHPEVQYTLVDISEEMLERARQALSPYRTVSFVESDFLSFSPRESFDGFFSSRAIEYMPDVAQVAAKISAVLKPGARGALITKMPKPFFDSVRGRVRSPLHQGQISPKNLVGHLQAAGLRVLKVRPATATVPLLGSPGLNRFTFACIRHLPVWPPLSLFAESYCIIFEKKV